MGALISLQLLLQRSAQTSTYHRRKNVALIFVLQQQQNVRQKHGEDICGSTQEVPHYCQQVAPTGRSQCPSPVSSNL